MSLGTTTEPASSIGQSSVHYHKRLPRLSLAAFLGMGTTCLVEMIFNRPGVRALAMAAGIGGIVSLFCYALTNRPAERRSPMLRRLAFASSASLLLLSFLPEYVLGGHVWPIRTITLVGIAAALSCILYLADAVSPADFLAKRSPESISTRQLRWFMSFLAAYFAVIVFASVRKYQMLGYAGQDLAYFSQIFYTTLHGRLFNSNFYQDLLYTRTVTSDFAGHNSPIQFLFVAFYRFFPSPVTLLVVRDAMITLCAIPAYRLARNWLSPGFSFALAAIFLLDPAILFQNLFEFYPFSIAAFFLLWSLDCFARKNFVGFTLALLATLMVREDLVFAAFALAGFAIWHRRTRKWVLTPAILGVAWGFLSWRIILPHFLHGAPLRSNVCFCHLGATPAEMWSNITHHPMRYILTRNSLVYIKQLTAPFGFIAALLNPIAWGASPYLAINLLGGEGECPTTSIFSQHAVVPTTFLFAGFIWSVRWLQSKAPSYNIPVGRVASTLITFAASLTLANLAFSVYPEQFNELRYKSYVPEARSVAALIPPDAAVAAPRYMCPLLPNRMSLYMTDDLFDYHHPDPGYIIVDRDFDRMRRTPKWRVMYDRVTYFLQHDPNIKVIYKSSNYIVYLRPPNSLPLDRRDP